MARESPTPNADTITNRSTPDVFADAMTARTVSVISVGVSRTFLTPSVLMTASWPSGCRGDHSGVGDVAADGLSAQVNGGVGPPNEGGDLMALVECFFDEVDAGTAGCSKDKKLHNLSLSIERMKRMNGRDGERARTAVTTHPSPIDRQDH